MRSEIIGIRDLLSNRSKWVWHHPSPSQRHTFCHSDFSRRLPKQLSQRQPRDLRAKRWSSCLLIRAHILRQPLIVSETSLYSFPLYILTCSCFDIVQGKHNIVSLQVQGHQTRTGCGICTYEAAF